MRSTALFFIDMVIVQDADPKSHPAEIPRLMQPILDGKADEYNLKR